MTTRLKRSVADLGIEVGDIFRCSWGYEQTQVDLFEVVALTKCAVKIRPVRGRREERGSGSTRVFPPSEPGMFINDEVLTKFPWCYVDENTGEERFGLKMTSYSDAYKVTDEQRAAGFHETSQGWGH